MTRILTALVGIPLVLAVICTGPSWLFTLLVSMIAVLALDEFLTLCRNRGLQGPGRWFLIFGAGLTASFLVGPRAVLVLLFAAAVGLSVVGLNSGPGTGGLDRLTAGIAGLVYVCVPLGLLIELSRPDEVVLLLGIVWTGDTAAYYVGRRLGLRRLAPRISPQKTVAGSVGGLLASIVFAVAVGRWLLELSATWLATVGIVTAVAGQVGDLVESGIKRSARVKDSSERLPGHGGFLDRVDSLLFAAPVFLFLLRF